jgi:hypothetical protein
LGQAQGFPELHDAERLPGFVEDADFTSPDLSISAEGGFPGGKRTEVWTAQSGLNGWDLFMRSL